MSDAIEVTLGPDDGDQVRIEVWRRAHPGGLAQFDHNWLTTEVQVRSVQRSWRYHAFLRATDFARFGARLAALAAGDRRRAVFEPTDPWVAVDIAQREPGVFDVGVRAREGGSEKAVQLAFTLDTAGLDALTAQMRQVSARFPVVE